MNGPRDQFPRSAGLTRHEPAAVGGTRHAVTVRAPAPGPGSRDDYRRCRVSDFLAPKIVFRCSRAPGVLQAQLLLQLLELVVP